MNVLINESRIEKRLDEMAKEIDKEYEGKEIILIGILKGSVVFMVELAKRLKQKYNLNLSKYLVMKEQKVQEK